MGRARFKHFWPPAAAEIDRHNPDTGDPVFRDRDRCTEAAARLVEQRRGNARWRFVARPGRDHRELAHAVEDRFALVDLRSEEHPSELQSIMRNSFAVFCLKKKKKRTT